MKRKPYSWTFGLAFLLGCSTIAWAGNAGPHAIQSGNQAASQPSSNVTAHTAMRTMMKNCSNSMDHMNGRLKALSQTASKAEASRSRLRMKTVLGKISAELSSLRGKMQTCRGNMRMVHKIMQAKPGR